LVRAYMFFQHLFSFNLPTSQLIVFLLTALRVPPASQSAFYLFVINKATCKKQLFLTPLLNWY